jgi:hypothetical protein
MKTCPISCSPALLENNRNYCSLYLYLFTYFWKNYLLLSDGERMPINQYLGESRTESNPAGDATKILLCLLNEGI